MPPAPSGCGDAVMLQLAGMDDQVGRITLLVEAHGFRAASVAAGVGGFTEGSEFNTNVQILLRDKAARLIAAAAYEHDLWLSATAASMAQAAAFCPGLCDTEAPAWLRLAACADPSPAEVASQELRRLCSGAVRLLAQQRQLAPPAAAQPRPLAVLYEETEAATLLLLRLLEAATLMLANQRATGTLQTFSDAGRGCLATFARLCEGLAAAYRMRDEWSRTARAAGMAPMRELDLSQAALDASTRQLVALDASTRQLVALAV
jgi:hypothetical protein